MASNDHDISQGNGHHGHEHGHAHDGADPLSQLGRDSQLGREPECREALDRLYHYLDGELTDDRRHQIQEHLETCMPCLEAFDFEAELKLLIARRCRDEVPQQLQERVREALALASTGSEPEGGAGAERRSTGREAAADENKSAG